jgi:threonine/homoserine/homoserine lactone efflux protein
METILSGIGMGIMLSFLMGPGFFALLKTSIEKGFHAGISLAGGILLSDVFFVAISLFGSSYLRSGQVVMEYIGYAGTLILLGIGFYYWFKKDTLELEHAMPKSNKLGYFLKGFIMSLFNPTLLLYWLSISSWVVSVVGKFETQKVIPFFASILLTQFILDVIKAYFANKLRKRMTQKNLMWLNRIAGTLLILFGLKLLYSMLINHSLA